MNKIFKARLVDSSLRTSKRTRDTGEMATRTCICRYSGTAFSAEREGEDLVVYHNGSQQIPTGTLGDRRPTGMTASKMQAQIEFIRKDKANAW
jgi:hypothetical protein